MHLLKLKSFFKTFPAQLWKYDSDTKVLTNKEGVWTSTDETWNIPANNTEGNIEAASGQVLGLKEDATAIGTEVILEESDSSDHQLWLQEMGDDGYFTLKNKVTEKFLTATSSSEMAIQGAQVGTYLFVFSLIFFFFN